MRGGYATTAQRKRATLEEFRQRLLDWKRALHAECPCAESSSAAARGGEEAALTEEQRARREMQFHELFNIRCAGGR